MFPRRCSRVNCGGLWGRELGWKGGAQKLVIKGRGIQKSSFKNKTWVPRRLVGYE